MSLLMALTAVGLFSLLAFWKLHAVLFMLAAGSSLMLGFSWYDIYVTNIGLTISLMFMAYGLFCIGMAFKMLFWSFK